METAQLLYFSLATFYLCSLMSFLLDCFFRVTLWSVILPDHYELFVVVVVVVIFTYSSRKISY